MAAICKFSEAWTGACKTEAEPNSEYCKAHKDLRCNSCGAQAVRSCDETLTGFGMVCGAPLCDECEHEIAPDGTNGGVSNHVRKTDQRYKTWALQSPEEELQGHYLMLKRNISYCEQLSLRMSLQSALAANERIKEEYTKALTLLEEEHPHLKGLEECNINAQKNE